MVVLHLKSTSEISKNMAKSNIQIVDTLPKEIEEKMRNDLIAYEASHGIDVNYKPFSLVMKNDADEIIGVLNAYTAFAEIYIDDIWVDSGSRRKGYGKLLISHLENTFRGKGFNNINLVTSAFQAPEFYKKCGFIPEFTRINKLNPKLNKTFFVKYFDDQTQHQGLLVKD